MHFHLPKPLHGWRAFFGEVGVIVIGVLIALGLGAIVDDVQWQAKVAEARLQLRQELGQNLALLDNRISLQSCVDRRLDQLGIILNQASTSGRLPSVGPIGGAPSYTWPLTVWDSQVAAETATHFPAQQIASIGRVYAFIGLARQVSDQERTAWLRLNGMVGPGRPVDAATIGALVDALVAARSTNDGFTGMRQAISKILSSGGLGSDFPQIDRKNPPFLAGHRMICDPIGKPPASYGHV